MGGVDLLDRFKSQYSPTVVGKNWYWSLFFKCVSMATRAAWRIHVITHVVENKVDVIVFTRSIVTNLQKNLRATTSGQDKKHIQNKNEVLHLAVEAEKQGSWIFSKKNAG